MPTENSPDGDLAKLKEQVAAYAKVRKDYEIFTRCLRAVLEKACHTHLPNSLVQAREKTMGSFAEKAVRRRDRYKNPVEDFTDLCGARIIVQTHAQVEALCQFIRANFEVCEEDNKQATLGDAEFGYGDMHFIVKIKNENFKVLGISEKDFAAIKGKRAEIQVRTWLQHAIADALHDRIYKNKMGLKFSREIVRLANMLDAIRENADNTMNALCTEIDSRLANYQSFASRKEIEEETGRLTLLLELNSESPDIWKTALQRARLLSAIGNYDEAIRSLESYENAGQEHPEILIELGNAYLHFRNKEGEIPKKSLEKAKSHLQTAVTALSEPSTAVPYDKEEYKGNKARANFLLATALAKLNKSVKNALDTYHAALDCEPANPKYLTGAIGYRFAHNGEADTSPLEGVALRTALKLSHEHIKTRTELPYACFVAGRIQALLKKPLEALADYALGVAMFRSGKVGVPPTILDDETDWLEDVQGGAKTNDDIKKSCALCTRFLNLAKQPARNDSPAAKFQPPVLIFCSADNLDETEYSELTSVYQDALPSFSGTLISGGTTAGISGLLGDVAKKIKTDRAKKFKIFGYPPKDLPRSIKHHPSYDKQRMPESDSPCEQFIKYWEDIVASGIPTSAVNVFAHAGGLTSALECRIALALGATVWAITRFGDNTANAATDILKDTLWDGYKDKLLPLFYDASVLRMVLASEKTPELDREKIEIMAQNIHEHHVQHTPAPKTENREPWDNLKDTYKESNRDQAQWIIKMLNTRRIFTRPSENPKSFELTAEDIDHIQVLEHGRWMIERLRNGWTYGPKRDNNKKIHPLLKPWDKLPEAERDKDNSAVKNWPNVLAKVKLELYRTEETETTFPNKNKITC